MPCGAFRSVTGHRLRVIGGDDNEVVVGGSHVNWRDTGGVCHGPRVEGRDLVVLHVVINEARRGELSGDWPKAAEVDPVLFQPCAVLGEVLADRSYEDGTIAQKSEVEGDVRPGPASLPLQGIHQEGDAQDVHLLGEDMLAELARENHDVVVSDRPSNKRSHDEKSASLRSKKFSAGVPVLEIRIPKASPGSGRSGGRRTLGPG